MILRAASASTRASYVRSLDALIKRVANLGSGSLRGIYSTLTDARREVASIVTETDWSRSHYGVLKDRIERALADLRPDLTSKLHDDQRSSYGEAGEELDDLLSRFGGEDERLYRPLDTRRLATWTDFSADLITRVSRDVIGDVSRELRLGMLADRSPFDVLQRIGTKLVDRDGNPAPGVWGDTLTRAEIIFRTEVNRVYALGTQARMEQHEQIRPGLRKVWLHSRSRNPRASHVRAGQEYGVEGEPIGVNELFEIHGEDGTYEARYPRDPRLPPSESVSCGCAMAPYRENWRDVEGRRAA